MAEPATQHCGICGEDKPVKAFGGSNTPNCILCTTAHKIAVQARQLEERRAARTRKEAITAERGAEKLKKDTAVRRKRTTERQAARKIVKEQRKAKREVKKVGQNLNMAQRELAARILAQKHLLPFIVRHKPDYVPGWVHKDNCLKL